jgi:hypothetical protein
LFTADWFLAGLVHSRGGNDDDHLASSFARLAAFCTRHDLPFELDAAPALAPFVIALAGKRSAMLFLWRQDDPEKRLCAWLRLELDQRDGGTFAGTASDKEGNDARFALVVDGSAGTLSLPRIGSLKSWRLTQLRFALDSADDLPGFAIYHVEHVDGVCGELVVPRGEPRLALEQILGELGVKAFRENAARLDRPEEVLASDVRPPRMPLYFQVLEQKRRSDIELVVPPPLDQGFVLLGRVSFSSSYRSLDRKVTDALAACELQIRHLDGRVLGRVRVPPPTASCKFELAIDDPGKKCVLCVQSPSSVSQVRVIVEGLRLAPR